MQIKVDARITEMPEVRSFLDKLRGPALQQAGAKGLTEHAREQARQSVVRISAYTGVPTGRVRSKTKVRPAAGGANPAAIVETADRAISLAEYGNPVWARDLSPGWKGGPVSSMRGAEATGWNIRRQFPHAFVAKGQVVIRTGPERNSRLKILSMAVLANELAKPSRPNVPAAEKFAQLDLEKRVTRHVLRALGT
ncbi:MAG: hypothetical protein DI604_33095 [Delftia acidovorans]|nr:MAG: hypothetical protein DI604_33095 [Delftia acidovorans]